jgi:hypothetical protein
MPYFALDTVAPGQAPGQKKQLAGAGLTSGDTLAFIAPERGDVAHVVQRGHTLEAVAHGYDVRSFGACSRSNDIDDPKGVADPKTLEASQEIAPCMPTQ